MLETVLQYGTGKAAALGQFAAGKTGTTSNYGDAWFVGWDSKYTVAVWVGYPNGLVPMTNAFNGGPVLGGTFPALIWHDFMVTAMGIDKARAEHASSAKVTTAASGAAANGTESLPSSSHGAGGGHSSSGAGKSPASTPAPGARSAPTTGAGGEPTRGAAGAEHPATPAAPESAAQAPAATPAPAKAPAQPASPEPPAPPTGGVSPGG
jgi:penicillin-binding protein 1A